MCFMISSSSTARRPGHGSGRAWLGRLVADTRAAAAIEFAILLPFMVILLIGVTEMGRVLWHQHALAKGVRDGVRYLTRVNDPSGTTEQDAAKNLILRASYSAEEPYVIGYWSGINPTFSVDTCDNDGLGNAGSCSGGNIVLRGGTQLRIVTATASVTAPEAEFPLISYVIGNKLLSYSSRHQERHIGD